MPIVTIAKDQLTAELTILPGEVLSVEEARAALAAKQVIFGLDEEALASELSEAAAPAPHTFVAARGRAPEPGEDGRVELLVRIGQGDLKPHVDEEGRADYFNLDLAVSVPIGQPIALVHPPREGRDGVGVTGKELKAPRVREANVKLGEGVDWAPDGQTLVATRPGNPALSGVTISVNHELRLANGVGLHTGNIQFDGDVTVQGDVGLQMIVKATGTITVEGNVEGARLEADGGIVVKGGLRHHAAIVSKGNAVVRYAENAALTVGADLLVQGHLVQCETAVHGHAEIVGALTGGMLKATSVTAKTIGSPMGTPTKLMAAATLPTTPELEALAERIQEVHENLEKLTPREKEAMSLLAQGIQGPQADLLRQVLAAAQQQRELLTGLETEVHTLREGLPKPAVFVCVREVMHAGTALSINGLRKEVEKPHPAGTLREELGVIQLFPTTSGKKGAPATP